MESKSLPATIDMEDFAEPVYSIVKKEKNIVNTKGKSESSENQDQISLSSNEKHVKSPEDECESKFIQDKVTSEIPEYAVVNKSKKTKVVLVNAQTERALSASTPPHDVLGDTKMTSSTQLKETNNGNFGTSTLLTNNSNQENKIEKCKYSMIAFAVGVIAAMFIVTFILIVLIYTEIILLKKGKENCTIRSNSSSLETSLQTCLQKIGSISQPINTPVNVAQLENVIQYYLEEIRGSNTSTLTCSFDMPQECAIVSNVNISNGEWMKIADINTTTNLTCPLQYFELTTVSGFNTCKSSDPAAGCYSAFFNTSGMTYTKVYGRVRAYQYKRTNSFQEYAGGQRGNSTIDEPYVDGVSLTYGNPRQHIWTFASDLNQSSSFCPCGTSRNITIPDFVGDDYFCDSGIQRNENYTAAFSNPLWDGLGCCPDYGCCSHNCPPWFYKELDECTSDPIEFRVCRDQLNSNEDILIEAIDIYIHS